jgi:hypothetical protein
VKNVRFLVVAGVILSVIGFLALAAGNGESATGEQQKAPAVTEKASEPNQAGPGKAEPNSPQERIAAAWQEFEMASNSDARQMGDLETEKRFRLARAAKRQAEAEFKLIRLIAEQEGATATVAAIDKMTEIRYAKLDADLDEAKSAWREERVKEREERMKAREERRKTRREQPAQ